MSVVVLNVHNVPLGLLMFVVFHLILQRKWNQVEGVGTIFDKYQSLSVRFACLC